ncbi:hypothetical protein [Pseudoneobacillus sp. C159]
MNILFALLAFIIMYPILYFLPVKMTPLQKFSLLIVSLVISLIGIMVYTVIPFWQVGLLMAAFAGLASMILGKRMTDQNERVDFSKVIDSDEITEKNSINLFTHERELASLEERLISSNNPEEIILSEEDTEDSDLSEIATFLEKQNLKDEVIDSEKLEDIEIKPFESEPLEPDPVGLEDGMEEIKISLVEIEDIGSLYGELEELEDNIAELEDWKDDLISVDNPITDIDKQRKDADEDSSHYLSEIEKLLYDEENDEIEKGNKDHSKGKDFKLENLS